MADLTTAPTPATIGAVTPTVMVFPRLVILPPTACKVLPKLVIAEPIRVNTLISVAKPCKRPCNSLTLAAVSIIAVCAPIRASFELLSLSRSPLFQILKRYIFGIAVLVMTDSL